jgi:hypothetical protein
LVPRLVEESSDQGLPTIDNSLFIDLETDSEESEAEGDFEATKKSEVDKIKPVRSLIFQLVALDPEKSKSLVRLFLHRRVHPRQFADDLLALSRYFMMLLPQGPIDPIDPIDPIESCIYIFIDGLDRTSESTALTLLDLLLSSAVPKTSNVRMLFSGYPLYHLREKLADVSTISVETERQRT